MCVLDVVLVVRSPRACAHVVIYDTIKVLHSFVSGKHRGLVIAFCGVL